MLYRNVLISHLPGFVLCMDQYIIQILSHINLAALHLRTFVKHLLHAVHHIRCLETHFLQ